MQSSNRILVIGVDAATLDLIQPWCDEGRLPNFRTFLEQGVYGRLNSVPNWNSAPAWSSMVTGANPGKHGIFWFGQYKPDSYEYQYVNASYRDGEPVWKLMKRTGMKAVVINLPISYPANDDADVHIAGLDAPGVDDPRFSYPSGLVAGLRSQLGEYIIEPGTPGFYKAGKLDQGVEQLHSTIDSRLTYSSYFIEQQPWDFFMVVFTAVDSAQHFFWKYMRPEGFAVSDNEMRRYEHVIRDVYEHTDHAIGRLLELAGPSTTVLIVSDHGGEVDGKARFLPVWLEQMGMLGYGDRERTDQSRRALPQELVSRMLVTAYALVDRHAGRDFKVQLSRRLPALRRRAEAYMSFSRIDWQKTKAFTDGKRPDIWINLKGRFPLGIVEPGREYDEVCEAIREQFLEMRDTRSGARAVKGVFRKEEVYHGPHLDQAPDLCVQWMPNVPAQALALSGATATDLQERVKLTPMVAGASGGHSQYGVLFAKGPHIRSGLNFGTAEITDVAPTVMHLAGLAAPEYMDGRALTEIFDEELASRPLAGTDSDRIEPSGSPTPYSEEDADTIADRLRGLGYVE
jgi:predicted AlkP superfamily phosphohydrolase/phosphomutase